MDNLDRQVLQQALEWHGDKRKVWLVTVMETWGSAPRPAGALLAMRDDGLVVGSVSGGCVEDDLIERVRKGERVDKPSVIHYGISRDEAARFGLPCGGNLRLVQEPLIDIEWARAVLERTGGGHEVVTRTLDIESGESVVSTGRRGDRFIRRAHDAQRFRAALASAAHRRGSALAGVLRPDGPGAGL